jgi:lipoprotein-anchoring transpeptidase ErfK/SrfK
VRARRPQQSGHSTELDRHSAFDGRNAQKAVNEGIGLESGASRQPYLPRFMAGGPQNPLGARAMYLGGTVYRIHGTNDPSTIGGRVSSGCIRLTNEDVTDLYGRVNIGTKVILLSAEHHAAGAAGSHS